MKSIKVEIHKVKAADPTGKTMEIELDERGIIFQISRMGGNQKQFTYEQFKQFRRIDEALAASEGKDVLELDNVDAELILKNLKGGGFGQASKEYVKIHIGLVEKLEKG